jgi:hypothetical protein
LNRALLVVVTLIALAVSPLAVTQPRPGPNMMWPLLFRWVEHFWPEHIYGYCPDSVDV